MRLRPLHSASVQGRSLLGKGCVRVVCPRPGSSLMVHGCQSWMALAGLCGHLRSCVNMANRTHVTLCPTGYPDWRCRLHFSSTSSSLVDYLWAFPVRCPVPNGCGETRGVGSQFAFPCEGQTECLMPVCPGCVLLPSCDVHVGSACVSHLGSRSSAPPGPREAGAGTQGTRNYSGRRNLGPPGSFPFLPLVLGVGCPQLPPTLLLAAKPSRSGSVGGVPEPAGPLLC